MKRLMKIPNFLMIKEAADFVGVTPNTLRNWENRGKIVVYRHPSNNWRLYKKEDLENILIALESSVINS